MWHLYLALFLSIALTDLPCECKILTASKFNEVAGAYFLLGTRPEVRCANTHKAAYNPDEAALKAGAACFFAWHAR